MTTLFDDLGLPRPEEEPVTAPAAHGVAALVDDLNPEQRAAVVHRGGPLLIVAGAGSGKTRVLTHRIAYLLATGDARPGEILAITFTNKAAGEMNERVVDLVGDRARAMWVSTFHSACVRILREEAPRLGMTSSFSIYDSLDSQRLMTLVCRDLDLDPKRYPPRGFTAPGVQPQERADRPRDLRAAGEQPPGEDPRRGLHRLPAPAAASQRLRLRRPHLLDRRSCSSCSPTSPSTTTGGSATCSSTSTRTPTTRSTSWSTSSSAAATTA